METLFKSAHEPKEMMLERTDDGRLRLLISLRKLGQSTMLDYFLDEQDVNGLTKALGE